MQLVFEILKETILFWCRNFLLLLLLTFFTVAPSKLLFWVMLESPHHFGMIGTLAFSAADIALRSMQQAALLGLMLLPAGSVLQAMRQGIAVGWIKFALIKSATSLVIGIATSAFILSALKRPNIILLQSIVCVVLILTILGFVRFALALPVIIVERLSISASLVRAWRMTGNEYTWVVLLTYFVVRMFSGEVGHFTELHAAPHEMPVAWQRVLLELAQAQVDCLYLILIGTLYRHRSQHEKVLRAFDRVESLSA